MCTGKPKTLVSNLSEALHDVQQSCMSSGSPTYLTSFHLFSQIYHTVSYQKCQILQNWIIAVLKYLCQYEQKCYLFFFNLDFSFSSENEHFKVCLLAVCELFSHVLCHFPTRLYLVIFWYFLYIKSIICHIYYKSFLHVIMYHLILLVVISDTSLLMFT